MREQMSYVTAYFATLTDQDKAYLAATAQELLALHDIPNPDEVIVRLSKHLLAILRPMLEAMARDGYSPPMTLHRTPLQIRQQFGGK